MTGLVWSAAAVQSGNPLGSTANAGVTAWSSATTTAAQTRARVRELPFISTSLDGQEGMERRGLWNPSTKLAVVSGCAQGEFPPGRPGSSDETQC